MPFLGVMYCCSIVQKQKHISFCQNNADKISQIFWVKSHGQLKICKTKGKFKKVVSRQQHIKEFMQKIKLNICKHS